MRADLIAEAVATVLRQHDRANAEVCVLITGDGKIRELNRAYRAVDEATDVLTFPAGEFPAADAAGAPLGDVAISLPYATRQAEARGVSLDEELGFLAIHGGLHLIGYDDETEEEREEMVRQMNLAAREAGLPPDDQWWSILHGEAS